MKTNAMTALAVAMTLLGSGALSGPNFAPHHHGDDPWKRRGKCRNSDCTKGTTPQRKAKREKRKNSR